MKPPRQEPIPGEAPRITFIGDLQLAILATLWDNKPIRLSFQQLWNGVENRHHPIAKSTLSTTLTKLVERNWISRDKHRYAPVITKEEIIGQFVALIEGA